MSQLSYKKWLSKQDKQILQFLKNINFQAVPGAFAIIPGPTGRIERVIFGVPEEIKLWDWASLPSKLPFGLYKLSNITKPLDLHNAALAWALETYSFEKYKSSKKLRPKLVKPTGFELIHATSIYLVRDLINSPSNDMGPSQLAAAARKMCKDIGATCRVIVGKSLLKEKYPSIFAVGRSHHRAPRLIDIRWGNKTSPKVTIVGKGVCFDTGGLNLKSTANMALMKKDMGGAAHALGLARMLILSKVNVRLRVLIPAVENSISSEAMRPGDVIKTRKGLTVEIDNTDAEGRVILADALTEASREDPNIIIDFATLTGAARVALGTELPALFCNDDNLAETIISAGDRVFDPVWRLPLWQDYKSQIRGKIADLTNAPSSSLGGSITAALFLEEFIKPKISWAHFDLMAWNLFSKPGRPRGGEAMGMRAVFEAISKKFK